MTKLNVLVEVVGTNSFKCINTIIMEKLKSVQNNPSIGWHVSNQYVWEQLHQDTNHFNFLNTSDYLENCNKDEPAIYLVTVPFINDHLNTTWTRWIPNDTLKILKEYNIPIVISQPHEYYLGHLDQQAYHHFNPSQEMALLSQALDQQGLLHNDIIIHGIAATNSKPGFFEVGQRRVYEAYCYNYFAKGKSFHVDWVHQDLSHPTMARYKYLTIQDHLDAVETKDKISVCFNRQPRDIRCLLLLANVEQLDTSVFTFLAEEPLHVPMLDTDVKERLELSLEDLPQTDYTDKLRNNVPLVIKKLNHLKLQERDGERFDHMNQNYVLNQERRRAWFEMVTETHEWSKRDYAVSIITEKTIWPIINNMPFCVQGHRENYQFLKDLGFMLFEDTLLIQEATKRDLINENLDKSSLFATEQMYERFNAWYKNWKFLAEAQDQIEHNFNLLTQTDWHGKEKEDFIKICEHSKKAGRSFDLYLLDKFKF